ncbi:Sodium/calcium exchanger 1 [Hondaea fermentalgiana]|uniref:Sodium/calcium exchanger 1 n=1 Tax=Hondaea fermentalgiana TaxID=2315210 RepID=A0A2R5GQF3_9STRA|nr:Sodium/calcium exchanger 1 [Hondaea fermentalgiana]|eukprot:GBG33102.1 Sodium/calcium exchanger 1 [Hondaea fermentalgiana]
MRSFSWLAVGLCAVIIADIPSRTNALVNIESMSSGFSDLQCSDFVDNLTCGLTKIAMPQGSIILATQPDYDPEECLGDYVFPFLASEIMWPRPVRAVFYFLLLMWCFIGVAIISDHFMAAIEVITSKEKVVIVQNESGESEEHRVLVWNETVANLTLMALGSSAPEILLSVVETIGTLDNEVAEDSLGPSTIVGSAAFNLLCITAVCISALPDGEKRVIENYGVFMITGFFSIFAYIWMFIVLRDEIVEIWEAFVTLFFFPLLVALSYAESKGWWGLLGRGHNSKVRPEGHIIALDTENHTGLRDRRKFSIDHTSGAQPSAEQDMNSRVITMEDKEKGRIAELLQAMPRGMSDDDMAKAVAGDILKERATPMRYRIDARRKMVGGRTVIQKRLDFLKRHTTKRFAQNSPSELDRLGLGSGKVPLHASSPFILENEELDVAPKEPEKTLPRVSFTAYAFCVNENSGAIELPVVRTGTEEDLQLTSTVYYETRSGTARGGEDFEHTDGKLIFLPGETNKVVRVNIIDDNVYEPDETFQVVLSVKGSDHNVDMAHSAFSTAEVTIIDDDLPGTFTFDDKVVVVRESEGVARIKVNREKGIAGRVKVQYKTKDASAKAGTDYLEASGTLVFEHGVREGFIEVSIMDNKTYERDATFAVEFEIVNIEDCAAEYGEHRVASVTITSDEGYKATIDRIASLMRLHLESVEVGTGTWKEQLINALTVQGEDGAEPTSTDCVLHVLSFGWKVLFALVPPTSYWNGKLTFSVSLLFILILTAVVGDVAKMFGCLMGVPTSLTAITFVALGTSLPDTFASKTAAENDDTADNSIGNVTGSNSVNVFLGLGLPWVIGSIYKSIKSPETLGYPVAAGNLAFSVLVFCAVAVIFFMIMYARRRLGYGELGGPSKPKWISSILLVLLWLVYVLLSGMQSLGKIAFSIK